MTVYSPHRRRLSPALSCLVWVCCAAVGVNEGLFADTFRSAVYEFPVPAGVGSDPTPGASKQSIWMRVSNADRAATGMHESHRDVGRDGVALFEFFLPGDAADVSLQRVRFRERDEPSVLGRLQCTLTLDSAVPLSAEAVDHGCLDSNANGITVDLTRFPGDVRRGRVLGLLFELAPGQTIHTLIDDRLADGTVQAEVELAVAGVKRFWVSMRRPVAIKPGVPAPNQTFLVSSPVAAVSSGRVGSQSALHFWTETQCDAADRPLADRLCARVLHSVPKSARPRAPPKFNGEPR